MKETFHLSTAIKIACGGAAALICLYGCGSTPSNKTTYFTDVTATHLPIDPEAHALDAAFGDVDNDGDVDIVLALEAQPNRLYLNDGTGVFTWKENAFISEPHDMEHVRLADFDADGNLDCIFVAEDDQNHEYYLGDGAGTFLNVSDRLPNKSEGNGLDVGDVNGDGLPDIVVGNSGENGQNFLWLNDVSRPGYFIDVTASKLPQVNDQTQSVKLADLAGDQDLDMIIGNEVPPNRLLLNDGNGTFADYSTQLGLVIPLHTREVLAFDVDNDGDTDIVFANLTSNGGDWDKDPRTRLLLNDGNAKFEDVTESQLPKNEFSTYAAMPFDFDRDGDLDLLLSALKIPPFEPMQVHAYRND